MKIDIIYFTACGNTRVIAEQLHKGQSTSDECLMHDITTASVVDMSGDLLIVVAPVYNDKPPLPLMELIKRSQFNYAYYVAVQSYGGVACRNSLCYLMQILDNKSMRCVALASIVMNHSYITRTENHNDKSDIVNKIMTRARNNIATGSRVFIQPNNSYGLIKKAVDNNHDKLFPQPQRDMNICVKCGLCTRVCPASGGCINCLACVKNCPKGAIKFKPSTLPVVCIKLIKILPRKYKIY